MQYKQFNITFTENKPITRTIEVEAINEYTARMIVHDKFGSLKIEDGLPVPTDKIIITKVKEIKSKKER